MLCKSSLWDDCSPFPPVIAVTDVSLDVDNSRDETKNQSVDQSTHGFLSCTSMGPPSPLDVLSASAGTLAFVLLPLATVGRDVRGFEITPSATA